ncbi:glycosyltransferase family 2 protein [Planctomycetota bacterium]|nr:glycosyltransferase family 2 protein [Planctomycetota bacterium]
MILIGSLLFLTVECWLALLANFEDSKQITDKEIESVSKAIVVPAHNEEKCIESTLKDIKGQISPKDKIIVVAHNCSDKTEEISRQYTDAVIVVNNENKKGKSYAISSAKKSIKESSVDVVCVIDADCRLEDGALNRISLEAKKYNRAVQAIYTMKVPEDSNLPIQLSALAFMIKNQTRMIGLNIIADNVHITGSGFALPYQVFCEYDFEHGHIVEDMQMGVDLVLRGQGAKLSNARVFSELPEQASDAKDQRQRWEHGHLSVIKSSFKKLLVNALKHRDLAILFYAIDLLYPPLILYGILCVVLSFLVLLIGIVLGQYLPILLIVFIIFLLIYCMIASTKKHSKEKLPNNIWIKIPKYIIWKLPIYIRAVFQRQTVWNKTKRKTTPHDDVSS